MTYPAARKGDIANHKGQPPGPILDGSSNVTTNSKPAARMGDLVKHGGGEEPIVQGSGSVTINGKKAARETDKVACGEKIAAGSGNVFIGDGGAGRACSVCPGGTTVGKPVNPILGAKVLFDERELDFALPGPLSVTWQRRYSSYVGPAGQDSGLLGHGWRLPFEMQLQVRPDAVLLHDINGRQIRFDPLAAGEQQKSASEGFSLMRGGPPKPKSDNKPKPDPKSEPKPDLPWQTQERWSHIPAQWRDNAHCVMAATPERTVWVFAAMSDHPQDDTPWLPIALIDVYGRTQRFDRNRGEHLDPRSGLPYGQLLRITDPLGRIYQLHYTTVKPVFGGKGPLRLASVQLLTQTAPLVSYRYNSQGDLSEVTDEHGRSTRAFEYDRQHRMTGHSHLGGPWSRYTYASDEPGSKVVAHSTDGGLGYQFDYQPQETIVTDSLGRTTRYGFDGEGDRKRLARQTNALGHTTQFVYNLYGHLVQHIDPLGRVSQYSRDAQGQLTESTPPQGKPTKIERGPGGQVQSITRPGGAQTQLQHDRFDRLTQVTDPLGLQTHYRYPDPAKEPLIAEHPTEITDAQGGVKHLQWSSLGLLTQYTDCSGHSTVYRYDARGRLLEVTDAQGQSLRYERERTGQVQAVHHPDGSQTQYQWDSQGRLLKETNAQGQSVQYHVQYQYDAHGRVLQVQRLTHQAGQSPHTSALRYQWDVAGRLTRLVNEAGEHTHFEYDAADRLIRETGFDGRTHRYEWDAAGQLTASHDCANDQADAPRLSTQYRYDGAGQLTQRLVPQAPGISPDANANWTDLAQVLQTHTGAWAREDHYSYDDDGQLQSASGMGLQVQFERDALGRTTAETVDASATQGFKHTVRHSYHALGHRQSSQYPHAPQVDWLAYGSGHVHQVLLGQEAVVDLSRDNLHRETGRELLGAPQKMTGAMSGTMPPITLSRSYDAMGRLQDLLVLPAKAIPGQSISGQSITAQIIPGQPPEEPNSEIPHLMDLSRHHRYNRIGQLDHIEHLRLYPAAQPWQPPQRQAQRSQRYTYDAQQRLEFEGVHSVNGDGRERVQREQHWHYDNAGNRIHPDDTRYRPLERAAPGNRLHRSAQARYRHDAWGNVVQIDHTAGPHKGQQVRLAYDGEHRLLASERIQTGTDGQRHSVLTCYHYDPMSRRMGKQHLKRIPKGAGQKSEWRIQSSLWFGWDGDRMVTMQNESQASTTIYEPNSFVPMLRIDRQLQADERRAKGETRTYHVHCNHLGTPEALIAQDSLELVWQIELDPWGQTQREYNPNNMLQPIRMQGQQVDAETGLFYNRYRYYDPAGGRYVTQDPIGLKGGVNLYGYVEGEPTGYFDSLGLNPLIKACAAVGSVAYSFYKFTSQTDDAALVCNKAKKMKDENFDWAAKGAKGNPPHKPSDVSEQQGKCLGGAAEAAVDGAGLIKAPTDLYGKFFKIFTGN